MLTSAPPLASAQRQAAQSAAFDPFPYTPERLLFASTDIDEVEGWPGFVYFSPE
ncbi:hypothetical protein R82526_02888 [Ralstonia mannitolilytica]|uniref:hypothetical protein n=1 Tax=Ralstonia mannitolilytica TaxID=105219 RepID=UPI000B1A58EA|nr:hypothetical protein [Ralstonia mannitolilytica]CAJ0686888.1 hypothetical protein R82526_02888 [Ralstonia mannitolilytica]CAJ0888407.1 hypothetical protein R76727_04012 [Ralstonia mannitolilytica]